MNFIQNDPGPQNPFLWCPWLKQYLKNRIPQTFHAEVFKDLEHLGQRAVEEMQVLADQAEREEPEHIPYSPWGERIDELRISAAWEKLGHIAAEEGIVATAYERQYGPWSRMVQMSKLFLYHPFSAIYSCPLAMTDGAARLIEVHGDSFLKKSVFPHLISRNPTDFWTSGQWMTEMTGGSDVGLSQTRAQMQDQDWALFGKKWFSSATTSQVAFTLARTEDQPGSRGLSLFYVPTRKENGKLNGIKILRLKDKLGTKALPTAELELDGCMARLVGERGRGVSQIATLFNVTRIYNSVCAVGNMYWGLNRAKDYAKVRKAFGKPIIDHPLHRATLSEMEDLFQQGFLLTFELGHWQGKQEVNQSSPLEDTLLRVFTPLCKLITAKWAIQVSSEVLECFGGAGYIEDTGLPRLLRDSQVLSIWEGTTNVLCMDLIRALTREQGFEALKEWFSIHQMNEIQALHWQSFQDWFKSLANDEQSLASARKMTWKLAALAISKIRTSSSSR